LDNFADHKTEMMLYHRFENFRLPHAIESGLKALDWQSLPVSSSYTVTEWVKQAIERGILWQSLDFYGWRLQHIGSLKSCQIPDQIEHQIRSEMRSRYGNKLAEAASIRLQVVYGGSIIPIHTDLRRESSIVYPILHRNPSATSFYRYPQHIDQGMIPPKQCQYIDSVCIDTCPTMLDVNVPHAVLYRPGSFTKEQPRVSLSLKFSDLDIVTVKAMIK
jgi:hypothetical protein